MCILVYMYMCIHQLYFCILLFQLNNYAIETYIHQHLKKETNFLNYIVKCTWIKYFPWIYQMHKYIVSYPKFVHIVNSYTFSRAPYVLQKYIFYVTFVKFQIALKRKKLTVYFKRRKCVSSMYYDYIYLSNILKPTVFFIPK